MPVCVFPHAVQAFGNNLWLESANDNTKTLATFQCRLRTLFCMNSRSAADNRDLFASASQQLLAKTWRSASSIIFIILKNPRGSVDQRM